MFPKMQNKIVLVKGWEKIEWLKQLFHGYGEIVCLDVNSLDIDASLKEADQRLLLPQARFQLDQGTVRIVKSPADLRLERSLGDITQNGMTKKLICFVKY